MKLEVSDNQILISIEVIMYATYHAMFLVPQLTHIMCFFFFGYKFW